MKNVSTWCSLIAALLVMAGPARPDATAQAVRISGVLFDGRLKGDPEPEEAIRLTSTRAEGDLDVGDFKLSDRYGPRRQRGQEDRAPLDQDPGGSAHTVMLPSGATIPPLGDIWVAHTARGFQSVFGFKPAYEAVDTDPEVPNLHVINGWLDLFAQHGVVSLHDRAGELVDLVAYDRHRDRPLDLSTVPPRSWTGSPLRLADATIFGWTGQILARDRDEAGHLLADTNTAADWNSGFSRTQLGTDPSHRVELPGQTRFPFHPLHNVEARVVCSSAPENNFAALASAFDLAQRSIDVSVYKFTNDLLADHLENALKRGVAVTIWTEGSPVGGLEDQSRYILDRLHTGGAKIYFLVRDKKAQVSARYRFDHSKYAIIDDRIAVIGTENYGRTGHPADPSFGNRGWEIQIEHPGFVQQLRDVWNADMAPGRSSDVRSIDASSDDAYGRPFRNPRFQPDRTVIRGNFTRTATPLEVQGRMDLALVLSPDNSLNENSSLLGLVRSAKKELLVLQNSIPLHWGKRGDTLETAPNLALAAVVETARRGVRTRVLVDGTWYNAEASDDRDNDDSVAYLNELARVEHLDLEAKVINLASTQVEKVHAKGVIVDGEQVFVGSINWSENSFKGNREVGTIVRHPKVAGYYRDLFVEDWRQSRLYQVAIAASRAVVGDKPAARARKLRQLARGDRVSVISEVGGSQGRGPAFLEVALPGGKSGYLSAKLVGDPIVTPLEANLHIGRTARVEGRVLRVDTTDKVIRLHFTHGQGFVAVIFAHQADAFTRQGIDLERGLTGKNVAITGVIRAFGSPEIVVKTPRQITILDDTSR
ncbi:MAG: phospholipase D-like domain-containing protein [Pseudomonadota bacterium]